MNLFKSKRKQFKVFFITLLTSCFFMAGNVNVCAQGQTISVTGSVKDQTGLSIIGATIVEKGSVTNGTITDIDGNYHIKVPENATITVSFIGFSTQEVPVTGKSVINFTLAEETTNLDELVVVGYGVQKKSDVTGAMVRVDADDLTIRPVANAFEALQGKAAGVDITSNERPGEIGSITIRGVRSLVSGANKPLYVVDGIPLMSSSAIETLNPRDIESIDILKDASATAIYGSRGANGVVLVTTKKGKTGAFSLNYSGTLTIENLVDKAPMMNASDYLTWRRWAYYNNNPESFPRGDQPTLENDKIIFLSDADPTAWANIQKGWEGGTWDGSKVASKDWTDYVSQTAITHEHTLSASGGTEKMKAYGSFGYLNQEGTQIGQNYERYTTKLSIDIKPKDWFSMGGSINAAWSNQDYGMSTLGGSSSSGPNSIYNAAQRIYSYALPYDSEGNRIIAPGGDGNVYTIIGESEQSSQQRQMFRVMGSFYGELDFGKIIDQLDGFKYRMNFGPDYRNWREGVYIDGNSVNRLGGTSYARLKNQRDFSWTLDNLLTYNKSFGDHTVGATLLQTASSWNIESSSMSGQNIEKPSFLWNAFGTLDATNPDSKVGIGSGLSERQLTSYMGRFNYSFTNRYLVTVSGRWDGASQLSDGHKWAFFPSAALGWRIDQESFMEDNNFVDQLKLRLGFGSTGNSAIDPYQTLGNIASFFVPFGGQDNQQAYSINEPNYNKDLIPMPNKELGWEMTTQYNLGVDFSFFKGRVGGALDVYKSHTTDLLMKMAIPTVSGYATTYANVGETKNRGIDISLTTVNIAKKDFKWCTNINAAWQKDEITKLAYGKQDMVGNTWFIGESLSVLYGIDGNGIWQKEDLAEMEKFNANGADFEVGKARPVDQNGDYVIDENDRIIIGNKNPRWTVGFNNTFEYKGLELNILMYGRLGYQVSTKGESQIGRYNQREIDYWTPENTDAEYQKPIYNEAGGDAYSSVLGYRSGSFLKLRTISLGYNIPSKITRKLKIQNLKVYAQAKNLGNIFSDINFKDMDTNSSVYNRGFVFGMNIDF
ncbi:TonB-dependent receptor [Labilibaculum manganireducens]|uniref:SusC/RagA family TonB-linked outer membrane protein n=1 Tax=Labilibaculum manganireducens TaxID=1940525 RepID=UPI0029F4C751|nr:TonB-dependent receptor [Labilibaculum manganireducens]